jgi:hypothetical protein
MRTAARRDREHAHKRQRRRCLVEPISQALAHKGSHIAPISVMAVPKREQGTIRSTECALVFAKPRIVASSTSPSS